VTPHSDRWRQILSGMLVIAAVCGAVVGYSILTSPTKVTVAVGPPDSVDAKLLASFAEALRADGRDVRLVIRSEADVSQSARALDAVAPILRLFGLTSSFQRTLGRLRSYVRNR